jgi:hypothetical protein
MPYAVYKLIHLLGIFMVLTALAVNSFHVLRGGGRADLPGRRGVSAAHGIGMLLVLIGGFGMMARLGIVHGMPPGWVLAKLVVWLLLGAALTVPYRARGSARAVLLAVPLLGVLAAYFALYKPF